MLKVIETSAKGLGDEIASDVNINTVKEDIIEKGIVYCIKNCFKQESIDSLRQEIFDHYSSKYIESPGNTRIIDNYCCTESGVSGNQKTLHYFHSYYLRDLDALPAKLQPRIKGLFSSMAQLYNKLTSQNRSLIGTHSDGKKFFPQIIQYPVGGGMFSAHYHPLEPQKLGLIVGLSKRGRDFKEGSAGFEMPNGELIDTSAAHDMGDIIIFKYDLKHWVLPCDLNQPLIDWQPNGRWCAVLPII